MRGLILGAIFSLLVICAPLSTAGQILKDSPVICSSEGVQCQFDEDNLIDSVMHVMTLKECRQICLDNEACQFITYFDDSAAPVSDFCQLFKNCNTITNCSNCVSENMDCFRSPCSRNVVGNLNENVLDAVPNVDSEMACKQSCLNTADCTYYTYFFPNSTQYHNYCFLQTEFVPPAQPCNTCVTSPMDCSVECSLTVDGQSSKSVMLTSVGQDSQISISGWLLCDLTLLVVGGGGHGYRGGGGGSGYLQYRSLQVTPETLLTSQVGDQREASSVTFSTGEDTVTAKPGQDGAGTGGDGYSGGGGGGTSYGGAGGTDGGDGERGSGGHGDTAGGHGTGEDVSLYSFTTWSLGPGAGGLPIDGNGYYYGGGGGGILVDGTGPQATSYQGAGYGGGGSGYSGGLQGIILMEIN